MDIEIKICGIRTPEALAAAEAAGADWVGFVFFPRSPRAVTPAEAARLPQGRAGRVGLFVNPDEAEIAAALAAVRLDALQIYADAAQAAAIAARFGVPVWHAVGVASRADLPAAPGAGARWVIEAKPPRDATRPGGNALALDWSMLAGWRPGRPWMLAGGLTPGNVAEAVRLSGATAVDVSSGVESAPGVKDPVLIRDFVVAARR
ncbi:MAG TPA: phosphoribosylanthranilate isomerase [Acetobacteraceae bacterium]|nr:phosphoribosylanthranilate isomerase [Acetobacteraceae bacterium]